MKIYVWCVCGIIDEHDRIEDIDNFNPPFTWENWYPLHPTEDDEYQIPMVEFDE